MVLCKTCIHSTRFKKNPFDAEYFVQCTKYGTGRCKLVVPEGEDIGECQYCIERNGKNAKQTNSDGVNISL